MSKIRGVLEEYQALADPGGRRERYDAALAELTAMEAELAAFRERDRLAEEKQRESDEWITGLSASVDN